MRSHPDSLAWRKGGAALWIEPETIAEARHKRRLLVQCSDPWISLQSAAGRPLGKGKIRIGDLMRGSLVNSPGRRERGQKKGIERRIDLRRHVLTNDLDAALRVVGQMLRNERLAEPLDPAVNARPLAGIALEPRDLR